jgi:hypothetical protein
MRTWVVLSVWMLLSVFAAAQHGTAPNGYYPPGYFMDTWSGTVTAVNADTREVTLVYRGKKGEETFTGVYQPAGRTLGKDGKPVAAQMPNIPVGSYLVAYYIPKTRKVDGQKMQYNEIFQFELRAAAPQK